MSKQRSYSKEEKSDAIRYIRMNNKRYSEASREIGIPESTLRGWVNQYNIDRGQGPKGALTTVEKKELARLRKENRELKLQLDFLKKAAAFFARETESSR